MATILPQAYDPSLGFVVPESIQKDDVALERFKAVMRASEALHKKLCRNVNPDVAEYALTQSHRRRVLVRMNARELYAFSRLREDGHAQWEIRDAAHTMLGYAREVMPLTMALACGKDAFEDLKKKLFSPENS
jgi:thymidylate synthase ThyX